MNYYVIKNNNNVYIRISHGKTITCGENMKDVFDETKAKNIFNALPKTLKKFHFHVEPTYDKPKPKLIENTGYEVPDEVSRWIDEFGSCGEILNKAKARSNQLIAELAKYDNETIDFLHELELGKNLDMYNGWLLYVKGRDQQRERRKLKDELLIISSVLEKIDSSCLQRERIKKAVDGLENRKYAYRNRN